MRFNNLAAGLILVSARVWSSVIQDHVMAAEPVGKMYIANMRWWKKARFGMFIHWGLYAVPDPVGSVVIYDTMHPRSYQGY